MLIAFVIMAVAFLALIQIFPTAYMASDQAKHKMVAAQLGQRTMDYNQSISFDNLADSTETVSVTMVTQGEPTVTNYSIQTQVVPDPAGTAITDAMKARITVTVQWSQKLIGRADQYGLQSLRVESTRARTN